MSITYNSTQLNELADLSKESANLVLVELIIDSCRAAALQGLYSAKHYGAFTYADQAILSLLELGYSLTISVPQIAVTSEDEFDAFSNYYTLDSTNYVVVAIAVGADVTNYYTYSNPNYIAATGVALKGTTYYAKVDSFAEVVNIDDFYAASTFYVVETGNYVLDTASELSALPHYQVTATVYSGTYAASTYYYLSGSNYILDTAETATPDRVYYKLSVAHVTLYEYSDLYVISDLNNGYVEVKWEA